MSDSEEYELISDEEEVVPKVREEDDLEDPDDADEADLEEIQILDDEDIVKNDDVTIVAPEDRVTSSSMTLYECAKVLGCRATHIDNGAPVYVDITNLTNPKQMALKELYERRCPLKVRRYINENTCEDWDVNEMTLPQGFKKTNKLSDY